MESALIGRASPVDNYLTTEGKTIAPDPVESGSGTIIPDPEAGGIDGESTLQLGDHLRTAWEYAHKLLDTEDVPPAQLALGLSAIEREVELAVQLITEKPEPAGRAPGGRYDPLQIAGEQLTWRELDVLRLVAQGLADKQIAAALDISPYTVGKHVSNILAKLNVGSRTEAAVHAIRDGFFRIDEIPNDWASLAQEHA
jgi:DNA-binding CsgD family transcriptional regulator